MRQISRQIIINVKIFVYFVNEQHLHLNNSYVVSWWDFWAYHKGRILRWNYKSKSHWSLHLSSQDWLLVWLGQPRFLRRLWKTVQCTQEEKKSALCFALFRRKSSRCFEVFVNYFFLSTGQTWLVFTVFHCIFTLSLESWKENSQS